MKLRRFCRVVISSVSPGVTAPLCAKPIDAFPKHGRVARIQHNMPSNRRTFLKTTAAGVASITTAAGAMAAPAEAQAGGPPHAGQGAFEMPRNMTLLNMRTAAGPRLGVKLPKGILDVAAAAASYKLPAPVDTDDLLQHGKGGMLAKVVAAAADGPARLYLQESAVQHAPLVTRPEKIIMMGFNYRRHAAETNTPIPEAIRSSSTSSTTRSTTTAARSPCRRRRRSSSTTKSSW